MVSATRGGVAWIDDYANRRIGFATEARENASFAVMVGGYYAEGATDFYTTAERRGTAIKKRHIK